MDSSMKRRLSRRSSAVWEHFKEVFFDKQKFVQCKHCQERFKYQCNTSNMKKHLKAKHLFIFLIKPSKNEKPTKSSLKSEEEACSSGAQKASTSLIPFSASSPKVTTRPMTNMDDIRRPSRRSSPMWEHFKEDFSGKQKFVQCIHCQEKIKYHFNTSNMKKHLTSKHHYISLVKPSEKASTSCLKSEYECLKPDDEACNSGDQKVSTSLIPFSANSPKVATIPTTNIDDALVNIFVGDMRPLNMIDGQHFQNFITLLAPPGYQVPSRKYITEKICNLYDMKRSHVQDVLKAAKYIALTADTWTSIQQESYLCLTTHFISGDFEKQHFTLSTKQLHGQHTAEILHEGIMEITAEFDIPSKISAIVTNNAVNMITAANKLQIELGWKSIMCAANTLELVLKKGFAVKGVSEMLNSVRHMVAHFMMSEASRSALHEKYQRMHSGETLKLDLVMDESTCKSSCFDMLQRVEKLQWELRAVLSDPNMTNDQEAAHLSIKDSHWQLIIDIVQLLEPFETVTAHLECDTSITISSLRPLLKGLVQILAHADYDSAAIAAFKTTVLNAMTDTYFNDILGSSDSVTIHDICYFLDPRFKLKSTSSQFRQNMKEEIKIEMRSIVEIPVHTASCLPVASEASTRGKLHNLLVKGMAGHSSDEICFSGTATDFEEIESKIEMELFTYLELPRLGIASSSGTVLHWWREHSDQLPTLCKLFLKYSCIPGTSAPSERAFGSATPTMSELRSRLTGKHVSALNFLHCNEFLL